MRVSKIIECLNTFYEQDDDLIVAWWDRSIANSAIGANDDNEINPVTDDEWARVCHVLEDLTTRANEDVWESIVHTMENLRSGDKA
jgi:hypothetical protein